MAQKPKQDMLHRLGMLGLVLFLVAFAVFIVLQFVVIFHRPYRTETAIAYTMSESVDLTGVVVFDTVDVAGTGNLGYLVEDGERVTNGTVVAERYTEDGQSILRERMDRLGRNIDLLSRSQTASSADLSVLTAQTHQALYNLLDKLDAAEYSGITDAQDDFLLAQNRLQISTGQISTFSQTIDALQQEYDQIADQLGALETVTAQTNGYFVSAGAARAIAPDAAALAEATPTELQSMLEEGFPAADTDRAGEIITGFSWLFYATCDAETAARFDGLTSVNISIPGKQNAPLSATVNEVTLDEEAGVAKVVLECQNINANVIGLGVETAQIDLHTYEGLRIDQSALHIVDGQQGVYVKYGNLQRFLKIQILYRNDSYLLVPADGAIGTDSEVRLYDEIIVDGSNLQDGKLL